MVMLKYKGTHQPKDMLIDVKESKVKRLLDSGEYALVNSIPKEQVSIKDKKMMHKHLLRKEDI